MDARTHIYTATAVGRVRVASPALGRLYPGGKSPVLILYQSEWNPEPVWSRRSEEKISTPPTAGIEPGPTNP